MEAASTQGMNNPTAWIDQLDRKAWKRGLPLHGDPKSTLLTAAGAGLDRIAIQASLAYGVSVVPAIRGRGVERYVDSHAYYVDKDLLDHPERFFAKPPEHVCVHEQYVKPRDRDPETARRVMMEFYSPFTAANPAYRDRYGSYRPNERVECRAWLHHAGPRPTIVAIHGFGAPDYTVNTELFFARRLFEQGLDVVLFNLPFHGSRRPSGAWFHGQHFVGLALWRLNEACAQAILDLRVLIRHLRARGAPLVGVTGYSLGGYHAALLAGVEPNLDFAIPMAPVVSIADLMLAWPIGRVLYPLIRDREDPVGDMRRLMAVHTPLTHSLKIPKERTLIVCGVGDRMAPPWHSQALWEHWGHPALLWTRASHLLILDRQRTFRTVVKFLREQGIIPRP
ncbi:MAG: alpha/beta hydrolase [Myxococcales bacterium]|nr:alpha/beta hydrolase [Myxococcales bacterium]